MIAAAAPVARADLAGRALDVAPTLLNKVLRCGGRAGRIVEVEAYEGERDPASHAFGGETPRNRTMFGPAGHLYVYVSYGVHHCCNVVCGSTGEATAVLIRALTPLAELEAMWAARPAARRERDLCSGPGKLCAALGIGRGHDGVDLTDSSSPVTLLDDGTDPPTAPVATARIGLTAAADRPWRFCVAGVADLSRPVPAG